MTRFHKAKPDFDSPITKSSTIMIYNLIRTNSLLSNLVERQNAEIEMQNLRIDELITFLKNKRKHTNKRFLRKEN
jgi:hypothetical protein|tara:strand:- start:92 stop:316 length:225 start_codon:yes stop_codon:yes gene_type:complete